MRPARNLDGAQRVTLVDNKLGTCRLRCCMTKPPDPWRLIEQAIRATFRSGRKRYRWRVRHRERRSMVGRLIALACANVLELAARLRPRRRRPVRSGERGCIRRVHEPGPDLHVDRTDRNRRQVADAFVAKFAAKAKSLPYGDPSVAIILSIYVMARSSF